jgi:hypothetical protein
LRGRYNLQNIQTQAVFNYRNAAQLLLTAKAQN